MAGIVTILNSLKTEFDEASKGLKSVDDNIKKITGREPGPQRKNSRRSASVKDGEEIEDGEITNDEPQQQQQHGTQTRKRRFIASAFSHVHPHRKKSSVVGSSHHHHNNNNDNSDTYDEENFKKPTIQSSVIALPKEVKPRYKALEEQKSDKKVMARNKRMFGMILGTLQKFQTEESGRRETTQKRTEIEKKLEKAAENEKESVKRERKELYKVRREKQAQIRRIELKMQRVELHQEWEKSHQSLGSFIQTKTKPQIFYMPLKLLPESEKRLKETKDRFRLIVAEKRAKVQKELSEIDDLYKKAEDENAEEEEDEEDEVDEEMNVSKENNEKSMEIENENECKESNKTLENEEIKQNEQDNEQQKQQHQASKEEHMEGVDVLEEEDKEFEPIYDE